MSSAALFTLGEAHTMLPGSVLVGTASTPISRVHTDTRTLAAGDLFVALRGERFDAHDFLAAARAAGAAAAIAERGLAESGLPGLLVDDSQAALSALAAAWRARFELPLIAVTGSNGKTTVTQMIAAVLTAWLGDGALATRGNLNNHIGVPLTLLRLAPLHRAAVVELGMNHVGEIAELAAIARPTVVVVNNAQREHQEFMVSVEAVARENGAAIGFLPARGTAVFPAAAEHAPLWRALAGSRASCTFGLDAAADVRGDAAWRGDRWAVVAQTPQGTLRFDLHAAGAHNVQNALAAAAASLAAGAPPDAVERGLAAFRPVKGRSMLRALTLAGRSVALVDDSYNANPDSVRAAIDVLAALPAPGWLVLGDMGEVGEKGPQFHAEVGAYARERGIAALWTAGRLSTHAAEAYGHGARHFDDVESLIVAAAEPPACASLLVKGSRFMAMERVIAALQKTGGAADAA